MHAHASYRSVSGDYGILIDSSAVPWFVCKVSLEKNIKSVDETEDEIF